MEIVGNVSEIRLERQRRILLEVSDCLTFTLVDRSNGNVYHVFMEGPLIDRSPSLGQLVRLVNPRKISPFWEGLPNSIRKWFPWRIANQDAYKVEAIWIMYDYGHTISVIKPPGYLLRAYWFFLTWVIFLVIPAIFAFRLLFASSFQ